MTVTDEALELLSSRLTGVGGDECFRVTLDRGELDLVLDSHQPGDEAIRHGEQIVLVMDSEVAEAAEDVLLDVDRLESGEKTLLLLERPR
jgi:hypothetical protein